MFKLGAFVFGCLLSLSLTGAALAVTPAPVSEPSTEAPVQLPANDPSADAANDPQAPTVNDDDNGPPSLFDEGQQMKAEHAGITVRLHTSRNKEAQDTFTLYPYPVKPPAWTPNPPLPLQYKALRNMILSTGYQSRPNFERPYTLMGWRWFYAYKAGLRKSGMSEPHTIFSEYSFAASLIPYVRRECQIRNDFEKQRLRHYRKVCDEWNLTHVDAESAATNKGLMPIALSNRHWSIGRGQFPAGEWWLQVTRKTPGVTYYWLQPITAASGQRVDVTLDDNNALAIMGGW